MKPHLGALIPAKGVGPYHYPTQDHDLGGRIGEFALFVYINFRELKSLNQITLPLQEGGNNMINHEIDLAELIVVIWRGRLIVLGAMIVCTLLAAAWLSVTPNIYRVDASIQAPSEHQLTPLQPSVLHSDSADAYQLSTLDSDDIFALIQGHLSSQSLKKAFWEKQNGLVVDLKKMQSEAFQAFAQFDQNLKVTQSTPKSNVFPDVKLALKAKAPEEGITELKAFIDFADEMIRHTLVMQVTQGINTKLQALTRDIEFYHQRELTHISDQLTQLREALRLAESLSITETPYDQISGIELTIMDNRLYLLGTKALQAEINILESRKDVEPFAPKLRDMALWKQQMKADLQRLSVLTEEIEVFLLVQPPEATLNPIKPKRMLVLALAVVLGGMLGVFVVLVRQGMGGRYRTRTIQEAA